ncbi:hypothetical protein BDW75DRAFT_198252 [Aspergillus navahoensis]
MTHRRLGCLASWSNFRLSFALNCLWHEGVLCLLQRAIVRPVRQFSLTLFGPRAVRHGKGQIYRIFEKARHGLVLC